MKIIVRKFTAKDTKDWDDFVNQSNNGTIFHLRSFLSYHIDRKFIDHSLIFEKNGEVIAVFPATFEKIMGKIYSIHILVQVLEDLCFTTFHLKMRIIW